MIGWIIMCIALITAAFTTAIFDVHQYISLFIMMLCLVPGYFIFKLSALRPVKIHKKEPAQYKKTRKNQERGKIINFPEGGRPKIDKINKN